MILFNLASSSSVEKIEDDRAIIRVVRVDTFHEIVLNIDVRLTDGYIYDLEAKFVRCPGGVCPKTVDTLPSLRGKILGKGLRKALAEEVSSSNGCIHLGEMVMEAARSLVQARFTMRTLELDDEYAMKKELDEKMKGTCRQYEVGWSPHKLCGD